jgi:hypothetical protein
MKSFTTLGPDSTAFFQKTRLSSSVKTHDKTHCQIAPVNGPLPALDMMTGAKISCCSDPFLIRTPITLDPLYRILGPML